MRPPGELESLALVLKIRKNWKIQPKNVRTGKGNLLSFEDSPAHVYKKKKKRFPRPICGYGSFGLHMLTACVEEDRL